MKKPKEPREWEPALAHRAVRSNTGFAGISKSEVRGRPALRVTWRDDRRKRGGTTVYYEAGNAESYAAALARAQKTRFAHIGARLKREGRILPCKS